MKQQTLITDYYQIKPPAPGKVLLLRAEIIIDETLVFKLRKIKPSGVCFYYPWDEKAVKHEDIDRGKWLVSCFNFEMNTPFNEVISAMKKWDDKFDGLKLFIIGEVDDESV